MDGGERIWSWVEIRSEGTEMLIKLHFVCIGKVTPKSRISVHSRNPVKVRVGDFIAHSSWRILPFIGP